MKMRFSWVERAVGTFIFIALAVGGSFLWLKAKEEHWFEKPLQVRIETTRGYGIVSGTLVLLNGIEVGNVATVILDKSNMVLSTLHIQRDYADRITKDAIAKINQPPILGSTTIDIQAPAADVGDAVAENFMLTVEEPEDLFAKIGLASGNLTRLVDTLYDILQKVSTTLDHAEAIAANIREGRGSIGALINDRSVHNNLESSLENLNSILGKIDRGYGTLGRFLSEDTVYREVESTVTSLRLTTEDLRGMQGSFRDTITKVNEAITTTNLVMNELYEIAAGVNRGEGSIGKLLKDDSLLVEAQRILTDLRETMEDIREQAPVSTFVGAVFSAF